jgi:hypothetical protein
MGEVVNLNKARKARAQAKARTLATQNRAKFGRAKADKAKAEAEKRQADQRLDAHEREDS